MLWWIVVSECKKDLICFEMSEIKKYKIIFKGKINDKLNNNKKLINIFLIFFE